MAIIQLLNNETITVTESSEQIASLIRRNGGHPLIEVTVIGGMKANKIPTYVQVGAIAQWAGDAVEVEG